MAETITLTSNGAGNPAITISSPDHPHEIGERSRQVVGRTWGGGFKIAKPAGSQTEQRTRLTFRAYPDADFQTLRTFLKTNLNYSEQSLTLLDYDATTYTNLRYVTGLSTFRSMAQTASAVLWNGTIELVKDLSA